AGLRFRFAAVGGFADGFAAQEGADGGDHRGDGDGQERPDDAAEDGPGGQGEDDHHRMQGDRPAQHQRGQQVTFELLHQHGEADHEQGGRHPLGGGGGQGGQDAGHEGADQGQERGHEGQEGQRDDQGDADDGQPDADEDGVDQPDGGLAAQVAADRGGRAGADLAQVVLAVPAGEVEDPAGEALGVLDEEEGQEEAEEQPGDDLTDQGHPLDRAPGEPGGVLGEALAGLVEVAVEVLLAEPEGARGDEPLHLGHALVGPLGQGAQLVADQRDEPGDDVTPQ